jgi:hypothetical protein
VRRICSTRKSFPLDFQRMPGPFRLPGASLLRAVRLAISADTKAVERFAASNALKQSTNQAQNCYGSSIAGTFRRKSTIGTVPTSAEPPNELHSILLGPVHATGWLPHAREQRLRKRLACATIVASTRFTLPCDAMTRPRQWYHPTSSNGGIQWGMVVTALVRPYKTILESRC